MTEATTTAPSISTGWGWSNRPTAWYAATRRCQDRDDDRDPREVLDAPQAVGEPPRRRPAGQPERDPERDRRRRVGEVVDRVREQRHAPRQRDDHHLEQRGHQQTDERPLERPQPPARGGDRRIDEPVRMACPWPPGACAWAPGRAGRRDPRRAGDGDADARGPCLPRHASRRARCHAFCRSIPIRPTSSHKARSADRACTPRAGQCHVRRARPQPGNHFSSASRCVRPPG